jgi:uncharacterized membrane protein YphA (DoxX/SURF4 family)
MAWMNILLWVCQIALALLCLAGGAFKAFMFDQVASEKWFGALPRWGWTAVGVFEMVCGVLVVVPAAAHWMPMLTPLAAVALVLETLALAALYGRYSLKVAASNPLVFAVAMAALAAFVAWGRYLPA